jgi:hypothetical protein
LTAAEPKLVTVFLSGDLLAGYAAANRITMNIVRAQLKQVFVKTGQNHQTDFVRELTPDPIVSGYPRAWRDRNRSERRARELPAKKRQQPGSWFPGRQRRRRFRPPRAFPVDEKATAPSCHEA